MIKRRLKLTNYPPLMEEINKVLKTVSYGSVEIYVQDNKVTQLTVRKIVKTKYNINEDENIIPQETLKKTLAKNGIDLKTIQISQNQVRLGQKQAHLPQNRVLTKENQ